MTEKAADKAEKADEKAAAKEEQVADEREGKLIVEGELTQEELEAKEAEDAEANDAEAPVQEFTPGGYSDLAVETVAAEGVEADEDAPVLKKLPE